MGLWDGVNNVSVFPLVDGSRIFRNENALSNGVTQTESPITQDGGVASAVGVGEAFAFTIDWTLGASSTSITLNILGENRTYTTTNPFDRTNGLSILFAKQSTGEEFQLNSVSVSGDYIGGGAVIPLPAGLPLLLTGLGGMALLGRRKAVKA
ncbi:VPLPA-CTERM sorting domain-containing protein [Rhodovulum marinum]|uniref:VPLPA-CTERM sorting domain-containing protein n=1 Tax=Rhodovulum marinum TaxID=320662 RepID=UPI0014054251|nr:VPLPA-CTERM sorting domain-containing protein [Rhodovulum marinum]